MKDTQPAALRDSAIDDFRIGSPVEIAALLRQIQDGGVLVSLSGPSGLSYTTTLWALDTQRGTLSLSASEDEARLTALLEGHEVVAVAYLDSIKVQFDLDGLVLVRGGHHSTLQARVPREVFRFQRRSTFRVQPLSSKGPMAIFRHPHHRDQMLSLRVLDISMGGVALFLPDDVAPLPAGIALEPVQLSLDAETSFDVGLIVQHVTVIHPESRGSRLGCEWIRAQAHERSLLHYINHTQKRRLALPPGRA